MQRLVILLFLCFCCGPKLIGQLSFVPQDTTVANILAAFTTPVSSAEVASSIEQNLSLGALDTALAYCYLSLNIACESQEEKEIMKAYDDLYTTYSNQGKFEEFIPIANELRTVLKRDSFQISIDFTRIQAAIRLQKPVVAQRILEETAARVDVMSQKMKCHFYSYQGIYAFIYKKEYLEALTYFQQSKDYLEDDPSMLTRINNNLAGIYDALNDHDNTIALLKENIEIGSQIEDLTVVMFSYMNLAAILRQNEQYEEQFDICQQAIKLSEQTGFVNSIGLIYVEMGYYYLEHNQLDSAKYYFQQNIDLNEEEKTTYLSGASYVGLMNLYEKAGAYEQAAAYGEQANEMGAIIGNDGVEFMLASIYAKLGQKEKAYELMTSSHRALEKKLEDQSNQKIISTLIEDRYEQQQKEREADYEEELRQQQTNTILVSLGLILIMAAIGMYLLFRSRGSLHKANYSLTERNEALKQFAYITSHDLKEPIRNITSFSNLLSRSLVADTQIDNKQEYLGFITSNAGVLREIVDSLEVFTKVSFGELERESISLDEVLLVVRDNLQFIIQEKKGDLEVIKIGKVDQVYFSKTMLVLLLQNLIQNGFKYNESTPPKVELQITAEGNKTRFEIKDNGIGIESAYFEEIFSPFRTLTNKSINQSSGLGLSICKTIIERYDGSITVTSDGENGSTFSFVV